ncbi:MAG: DUF2147 domain-containing protein [Firmicutes bacterium]|jgi:uncharacterized protein (DUF2147 family)|nr:DUF2147 domain-containing protein [Bacillota bacterium]
MMKRMILSFALAMIAWVGYAQDIKGKWLTEAGDAQVEIYESNGKMNGKIVWLEKGPDTKDVHNKDEKLRSRKLMGVNILSGLTKKEDKWEGGRIYNPKNGKNYKCAIWLDGDKLKVRGYIGFLYETQTWKRK